MLPYTLLALVRDYLETSSRYAALLRESSGTSGVLCAVNLREFPRRGVFRGVPRAGYEFHGKGCRVSARGMVVDFDLGSDGTVTGVDPWKLHNFARSRSREPTYAPLPDMSFLAEALDDLVRAGLLVRDGAEGLYRLRDRDADNGSANSERT